MEQETEQRGIHQIPDMGFSNAYLVEMDQQKLALIDTGTPGSDAKVSSYLGSIGRKPGDISHIILTHADADHSGSAAKMKRLTGATLAIHELDAPRISGEKKLKEASGAGRLLVGFFGSFMKVERTRPDLLLRDGDKVGPLTIVHTPGHTDGSISIYKNGQAMFVGDLVRTEPAGKPKLPSAAMSRDMAEVKDSVARIAEMDFDMLLPGHGRPIEYDASNRLKEFVASGYR